MGTFPFKLSRLLVLLLALSFAALTAAVALSQAPGQKPPPKEEEEDPNVKPKPKAPGTEEEDPNFKPKKTKVIRVGDENMETTPPASRGSETLDLMTAYRTAKDPAIKDFLKPIVEQHDIVSTNKSSRITIGGAQIPGTHRVRPLEEYVDEKPRFTGRLTLRLLKDDWSEDRTWDVRSDMIAEVAYYEQIIVKS